MSYCDQSVMGYSRACIGMRLWLEHPLVGIATASVTIAVALAFVYWRAR